MDSDIMAYGYIVPDFYNRSFVKCVQDTSVLNVYPIADSDRVDISTENGIARPYALQAMEERGTLFIAPGDEVYEGMIVGENPKDIDIPVNPTREKHLTNHRSATKNDSIQLTPPRVFSLERAIEYIEPDELVEATPHFIRMRKRILEATARKRAGIREANLG